MHIDTNALGLVVWVALVAAGRTKSASAVARLLGIEPGGPGFPGSTWTEASVRRPRRRWTVAPVRFLAHPVGACPALASAAPYRISRIRSFTGYIHSTPRSVTMALSSKGIRSLAPSHSGTGV